MLKGRGGSVLYKWKYLETPDLVKKQIPGADLESDMNPRATQELSSHRSLDQKG